MSQQTGLKITPFLSWTDAKWPDWWPLHDYHLRFLVPKGSTWRLKTIGLRARLTVEVAKRTGGVKQWSEPGFDVIEVSAGLRARIAGLYLHVSTESFSRAVLVELQPN